MNFVETFCLESKLVYTLKICTTINSDNSLLDERYMTIFYSPTKVIVKCIMMDKSRYKDPVITSTIQKPTIIIQAEIKGKCPQATKVECETDQWKFFNSIIL